MIRCPVCESHRVVVVVSPSRKAFCARCGSKWIQEGSFQRGVRPATVRTRRREVVTEPTA